METSFTSLSAPKQPPSHAHSLRQIWNSNSSAKLLVTVILLLVLAMSLTSIQQTTHLFSRAAASTANVSIEPASATLPQNGNFNIYLNSKTSQVVFARISLQFNPAKVKLSGNPTVSSALGRVISLTDINTANSSGKMVLVLGANPNSTLPTGTFELFNINLVTISSQPNDLTTLNLNSADMEIVEKSEMDLPLSVVPAQLTLNFNATQSPAPQPPTKSPTPKQSQQSQDHERGAKKTPTPEPNQDSRVLTFIPVDDSTIYANASGTNDGRSAVIRVDNSPNNQMLLKFNVSGVMGRKVISAKLRLYNTQESVYGGSFYKLSSAWTESGVTWNNAPSPDIFITSLGPVDMRNWYEVNLTSYITGDGTYSILAKSNTEDGADYSSKEGDHPPQLVLTFALNGD